MKAEIYPRKKPLKRKQWYWRIKASNGQIIAVSGEGYNNYVECRDMLVRVLLVRVLLVTVSDVPIESLT